MGSIPAGMAIRGWVQVASVVLVGLRGRFQAHANTVVKWRASLILIQIETCLFGVVIVASLGPGGTFFVWTLC